MEIKNGVWAKHHSPEPEEVLPIRAYAVHPDCDKSMLYSVENYKKAHASLIQHDAFKISAHGDPRSYEYFRRYGNEVAYLQEATIAAKNNPELLEKYRIAEAQNIVENISYLTQSVREDPNSELSKNIAEAVAIASQTLDRNSMILGHEGQKQISMSDFIVNEIASAEKSYYVEKGAKLTQSVTDFLSKSPEERNDSYAKHLDYEMKSARLDDRFGVTEDLQNQWWEARVAQYEKLVDMSSSRNVESDLNYFRNLANDIPELKIGEQLHIDFDNNFHDRD